MPKRFIETGRDVPDDDLDRDDLDLTDQLSRMLNGGRNASEC